MMIKIQDPREQLSGLQEEQLFALARNESAQWAYRKLAASLLKEKGLAKANHPEIAHVMSAFLADVVAVSHESEVSTVAESAPKAEIVTISTAQVTLAPTLFVEKPDTSGPFKASVTTETMAASEVIQ